MILRPPRSTRKESSAASDVYKGQRTDPDPQSPCYEQPSGKRHKKEAKILAVEATTTRMIIVSTARADKDDDEEEGR